MKFDSRRASRRSGHWKPSLGECRTIYPILDPRFWYAAAGHAGDTWVGTGGTFKKNALTSSVLGQPICLWRHSSGLNYLYLTNGGQVIGNLLVNTVDPSWAVAGPN